MIGKSTLRFVNHIQGVCRLHQHQELELVYNYTGKGMITLEDGVTMPLQAHTVTIYQPGVWHGQIMTKPGIDYCLQVDISKINQLVSNPKVHYISFLESQRLRNELMDIVATQCIEGTVKAEVINFRVSSLLFELYQVNAKANITQLEQKLALGKNYIELNYHRMKSVEEAAQAADLSPDYFRHEYKKVYGVPPKEYWLSCQLTQAKKLLLNSPLPQKAIAVQCGFKSLSYFNTRFKHYFHQTPNEYRKI